MEKMPCFGTKSNFCDSGRRSDRAIKPVFASNSGIESAEKKVTSEMSEDPVDKLVNKMEKMPCFATKSNFCDNGRRPNSSIVSVSVSSFGIEKKTVPVIVDDESSKEFILDEMSYMDLPDDIHINIMEKLDIQSRHRMRLNKRLDGLQLSVKNELEIIDLEIRFYDYKLTVSTSNGDYKRQSRDFLGLEHILRRLSLNTFVYRIMIGVAHTLYEENFEIISVVSNFKSDFLNISALSYEPTLPQVNLSTLLHLTKNIGHVSIYATCTSLSVQDLCTLRKILLDGKCKLAFIDVKVDHGITKSFMNECFGVTFEDDYVEYYYDFINTDCEDYWTTRLFRAQNESVELFSDGNSVIDCHLNHFEGDIKTSMDGYCICLQKIDGGAKPDEGDMKIEWNHIYEEW